MKIRIEKQTEKFTGNVMHYIYVDEKFIICKSNEEDALQAFDEAKKKAILYPVDTKEIIKEEEI
jgi:hypothetical protein